MRQNMYKGNSMILTLDISPMNHSHFNYGLAEGSMEQSIIARYSHF